MLNILHLPYRKDRLELLLKQFEEQGISEYKLWDGVLGQSMRDRRINIVSGHKKIVQDAKDKKLPFVTIAEDDISFYGKGAWNYYIDNIPQDYDVYFGMIYSIDKKAIVENRLMVESCGMTLYTVNERFYDVFLNLPIDKHIDRSLTSMCLNYKFLLPDCFVCYQNDTQSDNNMGKPDLSIFLKNRRLFHNC